MASTVDPLGGSWFVESLTNRVEREVWRYLDEIDRRGGMLAAIAEGYPQREIADSAYRFQRELDADERAIVGVNRYVAEERISVPVLQVPVGSQDRHLARLARTRAERDPAAVAAALAGLRAAASRPGSSEANLMPHFLRCAAAYATLGEQCRVLRGGVRGVPRAGGGLMDAADPAPLPLPRTSAPAGRALHDAGIHDLRDLAGRSEREVGRLHGMGPKALRILGEALASAGLAWRADGRDPPGG